MTTATTSQCGQEARVSEPGLDLLFTSDVAHASACRWVSSFAKLQWTGNTTTVASSL